MDFFSKKPGSSSKVKGGDAGASGSKPVRSVPWVEKYRPKSVNDVAYQEEVVAVLKKTIQGNEFPNLLFYGPPGTGKTSTILAVARELFGHDLYKSRVLELNASDERGIQVVRDKVKNFAKQAVSSTRHDGSPCPPFKIIILDEADSMTTHAQAALRRTMEKETKTTRFCLICNYVSRIIEPLTSRCSKFRFKPLSVEIIKDRLQRISDQENVNIVSEALDTLIDASEGDLRKAITFLQSAHRLKTEDEITCNDIREIAGVIPNHYIEELIKTCHSGSHEKLTTKIKTLMLEGYSGYQILTQMHDIVLEQEDINDNQKSVIMERLAISDKCLCDGADEYLQTLSLAMVVMDQFCNFKG